MSRTADGTTIITSTYHNQLCSFVVPSDLLEPREQPLVLRPQKTLDLPEATNVFAPAPYFALENPDTHHVLVACRDHPIQIFRALPTALTPGDDEQASHPKPGETSSLFSYRLISPQTEAYLPVHSLVWPSPYAATSSSFFVGSNNLIAQFNLHRIGDGPQQVVHTIPSKRHISKGNGVGMRGMVSALSMQNDENYVPTGLLAAGTWTRWVGLYDFARGGECVANWSVAEAAASVAVNSPPCSPQQLDAPRQSPTSRRGIGGAGINQTAWSPDGRYLLVNERQSTGVLIYDVRVTNKVLGFLAGRDALTHQRLDLAVYPDSEGLGGFEVWAGTRQGTVKVWQGVGNDEGCIWPSWDFSTIGESHSEQRPTQSPVGSVSLHKYGSVVATCTGGWRVPDKDDDDDGMSSSTHSSSSSSNTDSSSDVDSDDSSSSSSSSSLHRPAGRFSDNRTFDTSHLKIWSIRTNPHNEASPEAMATP